MAKRKAERISVGAKVKNGKVEFLNEVGETGTGPNGTGKRGINNMQWCAIALAIPIETVTPQQLRIILVPFGPVPAVAPRLNGSTAAW